jgi:hypothetical protein
MAHSGDGGALPCGWWSASGKCIEDCLIYHSAALTAVQADACCSTARYRLDDRALSAEHATSVA